MVTENIDIKWLQSGRRKLEIMNRFKKDSLHILQFCSRGDMMFATTRNCLESGGGEINLLNKFFWEVQLSPAPASYAYGFS